MDRRAFLRGLAGTAAGLLLPPEALWIPTRKIFDMNPGNRVDLNEVFKEFYLPFLQEMYPKSIILLKDMNRPDIFNCPVKLVSRPASHSTRRDFLEDIFI